MDVAEAVTALGGMAHKSSLAALGLRDLDLTRAVRRSEVRRPRRGWYSTFDVRDPRFIAVRIGGRLTGISSIAARGGWVLGNHPLHVSVPANASRLRCFRTKNVVIHWDSIDLLQRGDSTSVGLVDALLRVVKDEPLEEAVAALDWALRSGEVDRIDIELLGLVSDRAAAAVRLSDVVTDSIPESLAKTRLSLCGHSLRSQVPVLSGMPGERIDIVVDEVIGLEIDGAEFHWDKFESDRAKDESITLDGWFAMRRSARAVFHGWHRLHRGIHAALEQRCRHGP